jgi:hypothetical protein
MDWKKKMNGLKKIIDELKKMINRLMDEKMMNG